MRLLMNTAFVVRNDHLNYEQAEKADKITWMEYVPVQ